MKRILLLICALIVSNVLPAKGESMAITEGSKVKIHYKLTVDGEVADTSEGKDPLEYTHGQNMIIPGLETQLQGLKAGDTKSVIVAPEDGYGVVNPQAIVEVPKDKLPPEVEPQVGMVLQMQSPEGQPFPGVIQEIKTEVIVINFNHPLAGKELNFQIEIIDVR